MMDKAVRWLKALFGGKKAGFGAPPPAEEPKPVKTKRRWSFGKSMRERDQKTAMDATAAVAAERRKGLCREVPSVASVEVDKENKRAIAVAAATAAVAEAAVAAAQAAAVVVKLTSSGRDVGAVAFSGLKRVEWAAVKIQATFRGYLARRALRALRGLVKLQALVRGNIVRKQAAETLRCMQALVRVQARARACRALRAEKAQLCKGGSQPAPPTPEKSESPFRSNSLKPVRLGSLKRNSSETPNSEAVEQDRVRHSGWHWLDRWMEERNRGGQESIDISGVVAAATDDDRSTKILEIDKGKLQFNVERWGSSNQIRSSCCSTFASDQNSRSFITVPGSPSKESTAAQHSISSPPSVDVQQLLRPLEPGDLDDSPPYYSTASRPGSSSRRGPFTPSKSECSRSLFSVYSDCPNYMANTESSRAKVRSQSAPKQRPPELDKSSSIKRVSVHQQNSSVLADKSSSLHAKFANKAYPGSGRLDRLGLPMRI